MNLDVIGGWLNLHPKVKAAVYALGGVALGEVVAVLNGTLTVNQAVAAFVVAAVPVVTAYLKSAGVPLVEAPVDVDPGLDGNDTKVA